MVFFHMYAVSVDCIIINDKISDLKGRSRVFVKEGFDLRLSGLCIQLARLSQTA